MPEEINKEEIITPKPVPPVELTEEQKKMMEVKKEVNDVLQKHNMLFKVNVVYQVDVIEKK